eukprot:CAMPEP_0113496828 /NCGR_PEP_ID=MMETSP0014_2-20120614/30320_1 /TAXON_ID=2857 /ORGANISM="Nitzschia sp." /LENGTH=232 /DNA_ID=CAMNT_0000390757 /DNA_START=37 /DNA_END=732 /DNA_ORIENTATION=+ /assembly_acc=CAM_ASM_000159
MRFSITLLAVSAIAGLTVSEVQSFSTSPRFSVSKLQLVSVSSTKVELTRSSINDVESRSSSSSSSSSSIASAPRRLNLSWCLATALAFTTVASCAFASPAPSWAVGGSGAETAANAKITTGGASTLQSGRTIAITRGVNLDGSDFHGQNLKGVAFQQSIVRDTNFEGCNLFGASFFDATIDGSNFKDADMSQANVEMAQFDRANLHNTILKEMYVSGATLFEGVKDIEGSDW